MKRVSKADFDAHIHAWDVKTKRVKVHNEDAESVREIGKGKRKKLIRKFERVLVFSVDDEVIGRITYEGCATTGPVEGKFYINNELNK